MRKLICMAALLFGSIPALVPQAAARDRDRDTVRVETRYHPHHWWQRHHRDRYYENGRYYYR
jgi:hypothetical protein